MNQLSSNSCLLFCTRSRGECTFSPLYPGTWLSSRQEFSLFEDRIKYMVDRYSTTIEFDIDSLRMQSSIWMHQNIAIGSWELGQRLGIVRITYLYSRMRTGMLLIGTMAL